MDINQLTAILQNPFVMNMVQQVLSNPEMLQQVRILFPLSLSLFPTTHKHISFSFSFSFSKLLIHLTNISTDDCNESICTTTFEFESSDEGVSSQSGVSSTDG